MLGAESTIRPDSLQRVGASGLLHQLLVRFGNDVETLDDEALGDESTDGKRTKLGNDIEDRMRMRVGTTMTFTRTQLDLEPRSAQCHVLTRKSVLCTIQEVNSVYMTLSLVAPACTTHSDCTSSCLSLCRWPSETASLALYVLFGTAR